MTAPSFCLLPERALIRLTGEDATHYLQNILTCDMKKVDEVGAGYGALLTPQGKILFDFLMVKLDEGYLLDSPKETAADLQKRLTFYKLRSKVELEALEDWAVAASFSGDDISVDDTMSVPDPRLGALGQRHYGSAATLAELLAKAGASEAAHDLYTAHRVSLGVPESLVEFEYSSVFPHDVDMDQLNGVSFTKGCYVGQEVVARMHHRGGVRKRTILVKSQDALPEPGTPILADNTKLGQLGSRTDATGIAVIRIDKAKSAMDKGLQLTCGDIPVTLEIPEWAEFDWPQAEQQA